MSDPPLPPPALRLFRETVYVALLFAALATAGLLRVFHAATPRLFGGHFGSLLALGVLALVALHLVQRRGERDLFPASGPSGLRPALVTPLLTLLLAEKWVSVDLLERAYDWIDLAKLERGLGDSLYIAWTALALWGAGLAGLWLLRQSRHRIDRLLAPRRLVFALILAAAAIALSTLAVLALSRAGGARGWSPTPPLRAGAALVLSQLLRASAEEFFYRGLLQTCLVRLLAEAGLGEGRLPRLLAISGVSLGFGLEHYDPSLPPEANLRGLAFVFAMSFAFGVLLEASRNLYLPMILHAAVNSLAGGLWPLPLDASGEPLIGTGALATVLLGLVLLGVALSHLRRGGERGADPGSA